MEVLTMEVNVKLFANLQEGRFEERKAEVSDNSRVTDVINKFDLPQEEVSICIVNGRNVDKEHVLHNGDTVSLFPLIGGA
jgi:sulfur-carrier protein